MTKKINNRAHKRALKNARRHNNRNIYGKQIKQEEKVLTESFAYQWELFSKDVQKKLQNIKKDINVSLAKVKFNFNSLFKNKKQQEESLKESADHLNLERQLCLMLSYLLSFNCGAALIESLTHDDVKPNTSVILDEMQDSFGASLEAYIDFQSSLEELAEEPETIQIEAEPQLLTDEEKENYVLQMYGITEYQLKYIVAKVVLETGEYYDGLQEPGSINRYEECRNVISTGLNRISSASCISFVNSRMGEGTGTNIYYQFKCPGQYTVSESTAEYLINTDLTVYSGYKAVIETLLSGEPSHDMYRFVKNSLSYKYKHYNGEQLCTPNGNYYFAEVKEYDRVDLGSILPNYNRYVGITTKEEALTAKNEKIKTLALEHHQEIM